MCGVWLLILSKIFHIESDYMCRNVFWDTFISVSQNVTVLALSIQNELFGGKVVSSIASFQGYGDPKLANNLTSSNSSVIVSNS